MNLTYNKKTMRNYILALWGLLFSIQIMNAQTSGNESYKNSIPQILPMSPTAASFAIFTDYPVSHYTGVPNINVPLYEVVIDNFKLPITLNYHSSGIKTDQEASWVGLGWNLNIGGQISRSVKCYDDFLEYPSEYQNAGYYDGPEANDPTMSSYYLQTVTQPILIKDSEPDIFYYSFPGGSGKFLLDKTRGVVLFDKTPNIKIEVLQNNLQNKYFVITTPEGIKYEYSNRELTKLYSSAGSLNMNGTSGSKYDENESNFSSSPVQYVSTWYLSKIVTSANREIVFSYEAKTYKAPVQESCLKYNMITFTGDNIPGGPIVNAPTYSKSKIVSENLFLKRITWDNGSIDFVTSSRQDMIDANSPSKIDVVKILDKNNDIVKGIKFDYDYFNNGYSGSYSWVFKRLKLISVSDLNETGIKHSFTYNEGELPAKNSLNKDWWGYYNGKSYGKDAYSECNPGNLGGGHNYYPGASKTSNINYLKIGNLKSIIYPTGESTEFTYELNNFDKAELGGSEIKNIVENVEAYRTAEQNEDNSLYPDSDTGIYTFTLETNSTLTISGNLTNYKRTDPYYSDPSNWNYDDRDYPMATLKRTSPKVETITVYATPYLRDTDILYPYLDRTFDLSPGTYVFEATSPVMDVLAEWQLKYAMTQEIAPGTQTINGGGMRISRIKTDDIVKDFTYSTGKIAVKPIDGYKEELSVYHNNLHNYSTYLIQLSSSTIPLSSFRNGNYVGYDWVKESVTDDSGTSTTKYTFYNDKEENGDLLDPFLPVDPNYSNGLIKEIAFYKGNTLVKDETYQYQVEKRSAPVYAFMYHQGNAEAESYQYDVEWWKKSQSITEVYSDTNNSQRVTENSNFTYNVYNQLSKMQTDVNGDIYEKRIFYATDFSDEVSSGMKNKYQIGIPVETITLKSGKVISGEKTLYKDTLNLYLPKTQYRLNAVTPLSASSYSSNYMANIHYDYHNDNGKVVQIRQDKMNIVYLWSYKGEYLIAEIKNATYKQVKDILTESFITNLNAKIVPTDSDMNSINNLRTRLPDAHITTYTYKPLIGVTSIMAPNNMKTTYEYDGLGRLSKVKEHNGKIVEQHDYNYKH